jgi:hypothetical protein
MAVGGIGGWRSAGPLLEKPPPTPFHVKECPMGLEEDIVKLLKNEGFKINEAIRDALDEFVDIVEEENEDMDEDLDDEDDKEADEDE